ncbi:U32 family peptidase [uncultured Veillonella sp.]|uniref:U32 family peptidase n=1 Tax=uncultured Veillonella sp. TaxID=159268 RepID=UPI0026140ABF|nr:U32 family peptidase [uncultured Veillonella sp.]
MELLAPAGTAENFMAALEAGADAIYLGGKSFNARASAANFDIDNLREAVNLAHVLGVSVFVTVNILIGDAELKDLTAYLKELEAIGVDAIIVQDLAVARLAKQVAPKLHLHGSTQLTATNLGTVKFLERMGFTRVVLAREMSLKEIEYICKHAEAEIEVFVHGALCVCYSGQCLMSSFIGGRSGNRGACAQPCRLPYELLRDGKEVVNAPDETYIMSPKDLNYSEHMEELIAAGVASFKVEGRMKKASYVKEVIGTYRQIIDRAGKTVAGDQEHLKAGFNRGFSTDLLDDTVSRNMITAVAPGNRGKRIGPSEGGPKTPVWDNLQDFSRKYKVQMYLDGSEGSVPTLTCMVDVEDTVNSDKRLYEMPFETDVITVTVPAVDYELQLAKKKATSKEKIEEQLGRLGTTVFHLESLYIPEGAFMWPSSVLNQMRRDAVRALEQHLLKRHEAVLHNILQTITGAIHTYVGAHPMVLNSPSHTMGLKGQQVSLGDGETPKSAGHISLRTVAYEGPRMSIQLDELWQVEAALAGGAQKIIFGGDRLSRKPYEPSIYKEVVDLCRAKGVPCTLSTPRVVKENEAAQYKATLDHIVTAQPDAIGIHFLGALEWLTELGYEGTVEGESSLQLFNSEAVQQVAALGLREVTLSQELTLKQIGKIATNSPIPVECIVHGLTELMITEYCAISSFAGTGCKANCPAPCLKNGYALRDRFGEEFPIRTDPYCRMHIMNSRMLDMRAYIPELKRHNMAYWRIDGRQQSKAWIRETLHNYVGILQGTVPVPPKHEELPVTRGHYFKGIF